MFLQGKRVYLRPIDASDLGRCERWINDPEIRPFIRMQFPTDAMAQKKWHEGRDRGHPRRDILLAIVLRKNDRHIGNMGLHGIDWINRSAITGALIGEKDCWSRGYGREAKELLLTYAFDTLGLHRISSDVRANNPRSFAYLKKSGYVEEGRERESVFYNGKWVDLIKLGILVEEWRALHHQETRR